MEYFLIKKSDLQEFRLEIKNRLEEGWELHGTEFQYKVLEKTTVYTQAVIKISDPDIPSVAQTIASWNVL
jgi:hypothetical protein